jgi:hypothetical protein
MQFITSSIYIRTIKNIKIMFAEIKATSLKIAHQYVAHL